MSAPPELSTRTWIAIGTITFGMLVLFIATADRLAFMSSTLFYILLVFIALVAAAVLVVPLRSRARYQGRVMQGKVELGGAAVLFAGVIAGGWFFAGPDSTASVTVRLYDAAARDRLITHGEVVLDLGDDRRTRSIGPDGQVTFAQVPAKFLSGEVNVIPRVDRYAATQRGPYRVSPSRVIELELARVPDSTTVSGAVYDAVGPVANARVNFGNGLVTGSTDENGNFRLVLPMEAGTVVPLMVTVDGRTVYDDNVVVADEAGLRILVGRTDR